MENEIIEHQLTVEEEASAQGVDEAIDTTIGPSFACADLNELWAAAVPLSPLEYVTAVEQHHQTQAERPRAPPGSRPTSHAEMCETGSEMPRLQGGAVILLSKNQLVRRDIQST